MGLSSHGEDALLALMQAQGTFYLALFTSPPGEDGGGTEMSGGGYARQPVDFAAPSGGVMQNSGVMEFPAATADWGTASGWALFDAQTGGHMWWFGMVDEPKVLYAGDIYRVNAGGLSLSME